ncbi:MAG: hypothetical protein ACRBBP_08505 [Bdellovibrionales bacterium]
MKKSKSKVRQSGQFMLEAVLLMTLFFGIAMVFKKTFDDKNILGSLVAGPWSQISGMMSNGVWKAEGAGYNMHPQGHVMSREGDEN